MRATPIGRDSTIRETIGRALRLGSDRPDFAELAAMQEELRGPIALLVPPARQEVCRLDRHSRIRGTRPLERCGGSLV
ncbi:DUF6415 family natural product biosynthesis protein [Streptomyces sirii]|uniref:DUF6415 family natural product biosynthesis protein n=1 Tax=Streptomyces sirii TaxID=3127701 RepID=UPI003D36BCCA